MTSIDTPAIHCIVCDDPEGATDPLADYELSRGDEVHVRCLPRPVSDPFVGIVDVTTNDGWDG